MAGNY